MDSRIEAALIAATSALAGVIIGGFIQNYQKNKEIEREKAIAEGAIALYLCQLRDLLKNFSNESSTYKSLDIGVTVNENNLSEINQVINLAEKYDPYVLVNLFNIRQRLHNIKVYAKSYKESKDKQVTVRNLNIDAKHGLKEVDKIIKHTFNNSENATQKSLLSNSDFKIFLEEILGDSIYQNLKIKYKLISKI